MGNPDSNVQHHSIPVKIGTGKLRDIDPVYANYVQVQLTMHEVIINFGLVDMPDIEHEPQRNQSVEIAAKPVVRAMIPITLFEDVVRVINQSYEAYLAAQQPEP